MARERNRLVNFVWFLAAIMASQSGQTAIPGKSSQTSGPIETFDFDPKQIQSADLLNASGNIQIAPVSHKLAHLAVHKRVWGPRCNIAVSVKEGLLKVELNDDGWILDHECRADLMLSLPPQTAIRAQTGSGDIRITEFNGKVDAKVGAGLIDVKGELKEFRALSGSGSIKLEGFSTRAEVRTGTGNIELDLNRKIAATDISVITGSGDVSIDVPDQTKLSARTITGNGNVTNSFEDSPDAPVKVKAKSGSGNILIH